MRRSTAVTHPTQDLYLFQVVVLPSVEGVTFQAVQGTAGRTEQNPQILCPLINKEMEVVVFFPNIDSDDAAW